MGKVGALQHELGSVVATPNDVITSDTTPAEALRWSATQFAPDKGMWAGQLKVACRNPLTNESSYWLQQLSVKFTADTATLGVDPLPAPLVLQDAVLVDTTFSISFDESNIVVSVQGVEDAVLFWGASLFVDMMQF